MEAVGLAIGLLPMAVQVYNYLKQVKNAPESYKALVEEFDLYIKYAKQVEDLQKAGEVSAASATASGLKQHRGALEKLQALLTDPRLQGLPVGETGEQLYAVPDIDQVDNVANSTDGTCSYSVAASTSGSSLSSSIDTTVPAQLKKEKRRKRDVLKGMFKQREETSTNSAPGCPNDGSPASTGTYGGAKPTLPMDLPTNQKSHSIVPRLVWPLEEAELQSLLAILKTSCEALGRGLQLDHL